MPILAFVFSFAITFISIPSIIQVAKVKHLFDEPDKRKLHKSVVPTLGGLAIFAGITIATFLFCDVAKFPHLQYIFAAMIILFFLGIKDDIIILSATTKFIAQFIAAGIIVWIGDIRLTTFGGVFNIQNIPYEASLVFSILTVVLIINSFNLIDGIDGLAGTISFIVISAYAAWFYNVGESAAQLFTFSLAVMGALLAFLRYNITPAKIFMGDTGSLLMGTIVAVLTIEFINENHTAPNLHRLHSAPVLAFGIMIIPIYDLLRVFIVRIIRKKSPFHPDKIHVHHKLLGLGMNHLQATSTLAIVNILFIVFIFFFQNYNITLLMIAIIILASSLTILLWFLLKRKQRIDVKN
jgi:UDP-N-acetylmuramyl pentapeptide phosphotransferase/UDP-N-acetylglucosamine-1-phosphate transferase